MNPAAPSEADPDPSAGLSPEQLAEAQQYGRLSLICLLADRVLDLAFLAVMAFVLASPLDAWLRTSPILDSSWTLRLAAFFVAMFALHVLVSLPLSFYSGHIVEHRFKLSNLSAPRWLWQYGKWLLLGLAIGLAMAVGGFWIIWTIGPWWWMAGAAAFFLVQVLAAKVFPVLIQPLFYTIERLESPELEGRLSRLAEGSGLSIEGVYRIALSEETKKANAQLAGLGRTRRVLLGDTLLENYGPDEIEVIFAHEIGHHRFHHIRKMILAGIFFSTAGFWLCDRALAVWVGRVEGALDYASLGIYALPLLGLVLTLFSTLLEPLQNAISRRFERQCDRYAVQRTGNASAFSSAFRKLARQNKDDPDPPRLEVLLFHSHPPIAERLAMAEAMRSPNPRERAPG